MERVLESVKIEGVLFRAGDIIRGREIRQNNGENIYGKYELDRIVDDDGDIFFMAIPLEGQQAQGERYAWRYEKAKNTNKGAY